MANCTGTGNHAFSPDVSLSRFLIAFFSRLAAGLRALLMFLPPCRYNHEQIKTTTRLKTQKAQNMP